MASTDVGLRVAESGDIEAIFRLMREYYAYDGHRLDEKRGYAALESFVGNEAAGRLWVILAGGELVGYIALTLGYSLEYLGCDAFIDEIYIQESHRGRGIGERAIEFVEESARSLGVKALHLEVMRHNEGAHRFYSRNGYEDHDSWFMSKRLAQEPESSG